MEIKQCGIIFFLIFDLFLIHLKCSVDMMFKTGLMKPAKC